MTKRSVNQLRHYLAHPWRFQRRIVHHDTGQVASIIGTVSWQNVSEPDAVPMLLYRECGVMQLANYMGNATQTYYYKFPHDTVAEVSFSDGRFFFTLDLTTSYCDIRHVCGEDTYNGVYDAISATTYQQIWRVIGPRKDYTSHTTCSR